MDIAVRAMRHQDQETVRVFMKKLYLEDSEGEPMDDKKIDGTFSHLLENPCAGNILVLEYGEDLVGYVLIINYWSNEYGGNIVHLDEIYVDQRFRGRGIARKCISHLVDSKYNSSVAMQIQVMPSNKRAYKLYTDMGFLPDSNRFLFYKY